MSDIRHRLVLRGGRVVRTDREPDAPERLDIAVDATGRIARLAPRIEEAGAEEWDLGGRLVLPGMVDIHHHLDKTRTSRHVANPAGTLMGAVQGFRAYAGGASRQDILERAARTVEACLARGTVAIRTHANVDLDWGLRAVEALAELRAQSQHRIRLQVVAFITSSGVRMPVPEARRLLEDALDTGAEVVGGAPALAADPHETIDMLFQVAARRGRMLDLHVDETLDPAACHLAHVARRTAEYGLRGRVVVGHCCSLSAMPFHLARPVIEAVADAGVGLVTLPASNLFLQGRDASVLPPRGLTRVKDLLAAGVQVAYASDNIQDPFTPVGTGDLLETGRWLFLAAHLPPEFLPRVYDMGSLAPAAMMGLGTDFGIHVGACADLLIVDAEDRADAVASGPLDRTVLFHGRRVAGRSYRVDGVGPRAGVPDG
ncbi:MAG: amidohydrolase family protein [Armatimonadota bacterium]|nr:amidohydrolase family protein [Armatimonadota bacterium]MDR7548639.1 amidohydrolase family protein [Armatimonadota bacterium]